ncbi:preprotein translocase subunit SecE [Collinsella sp. zg1085]|uniref:preprotein translocase subunit SecE n=1 Tax=Collinsella sp. zg1085 TaxID=2844380 RepID=UPI001C0E4579|nr:preprotein translocase subunit SecE [Collinsella sp. zg1085]QWT17928.1 preprotein translocase subunit SecE [Collinsella sp. zg1085]
MAKNKTTKKAQVEENSAQKAPSKAESKKAVAKKAAKKQKKPGVFSRFTGYLSSVRSEMRRVVWPSKKELVNYSIAVVVSLVVVGVAIALLDTAISQGLVLFSGLRG